MASKLTKVLDGLRVASETVAVLSLLGLDLGKLSKSKLNSMQTKMVLDLITSIATGIDEKVTTGKALPRSAIKAQRDLSSAERQLVVELRRALSA
jgi:hypothetical protein